MEGREVGSIHSNTSATKQSLEDTNLLLQLKTRLPRIEHIDFKPFSILSVNHSSILYTQHVSPLDVHHP
ncbi:MAG: hypothetical protein ACRYGR_08025, partial [Janthinobacterium lividum]